MLTTDLIIFGESFSNQISGVTSSFAYHQISKSTSKGIFYIAPHLHTAFTCYIVRLQIHLPRHLALTSTTNTATFHDRMSATLYLHLFIYLHLGRGSLAHPVQIDFRKSCSFLKRESHSVALA